VPWIVALVLAAIVAVALTLHFAGNASDTSRKHDVTREPAQVSSDEIANLKQAIALLERKSSALEQKSSTLEHKAALFEANAADPAAEPEATTTADARSEAEMHEAELRELDTVLVTDQADPRDSRAAADTFGRELVAATAGQAQVLEVECVTSLCKAVVEEDTSVRPEMDTNVLIDNTPFLRREAMFGYERDGTRKRTIIYAAREGQSLAATRGVTVPSRASN
jgi:hypothetical protein